MTRTYRFLSIFLWSFAIALGVILYSVGSAHNELGAERRWTYPFFLFCSGVLFAESN